MKNEETFTIERMAESENAGERWSIDRTLSDYEQQFVKVLPLGFINFLKEYFQTHGKKAPVFDCMGFGRIFNDLAKSEYFPGGVSLSLGFNNQTIEAKRDRKEKNVVHAIGDVLTPQAWENVDAACRQIGFDKFGFIVCAPQGGLYSLPHQSTNYMYIINQSYQRLKNDGVLLMEVPFWIDHQSLQGYVDTITGSAAVLNEHLLIRKNGDLAVLPEGKILTISEKWDQLAKKRLE